MPGQRTPRQPPTGLWEVAGGVAPLVLTAALVPVREWFANTNAALLLVLLVVAVTAGSGRRLPGIVAAISSGVWFDALLTRPYQRLAIDDRADVETAALLLVVALAVSELAAWGRRQQAAANRRQRSLAGIREAAAAAAGAATPDAAVRSSCEQLIRLLGLRGCRFDPAPDARRAGRPRLRPDGQIEIDGAVCDIEHFGLPLLHDIDLPVYGESGYAGRFVLTAAAEGRPSLAQRLAAVALAEQVALRVPAPRQVVD